MIIIYHEEIIEITANLLGRIHRGIKIKLRSLWKCRKQIWKHIRLNLFSKCKLCANSCRGLRKLFLFTHDFLTMANQLYSCNGNNNQLQKLNKIIRKRSINEHQALIIWNILYCIIQPHILICSNDSPW